MNTAIVVMRCMVGARKYAQEILCQMELMKGLFKKEELTVVSIVTFMNNCV
jgi:hypothetical protein